MAIQRPADLLPAAETEADLVHFDEEILALRPALNAFAHRLLRQDADAEDLVQETLAKAIAARRRFCPGTNLKAWLFTIMRNSFNSRWRKGQREVLTEPAIMEQRGTTPATQEVDLWAKQAFGHLLHDLSLAHREILILVPVRGLSYEEAAALCGCSVGTIKSRLNRARAALAALT